MAKWPSVPAVYGWLALDRRGNWLIRGEGISNPAVTAFIGRNYGRDERGCWFLQNGPQRVFVELACMPLVLRVAGAVSDPLELEAQTGARVTAVAGAALDESGSLLLQTDLGPGVLDDRDLDRVTSCFAGADGNRLEDDELERLVELAAGGEKVPLWFLFREPAVRVEPVRSADAPARFSFVRRPLAPAQGK